jgi:hypothetical protein
LISLRCSTETLCLRLPNQRSLVALDRKQVALHLGFSLLACLGG